MLENGCLLLAPQQKRRTVMLTTILQIILPTSNQQHLSVELMSHCTKVLLTLTDKNKREERVDAREWLFVVGSAAEKNDSNADNNPSNNPALQQPTAPQCRTNVSLGQSAADADRQKQMRGKSQCWRMVVCCWLRSRKEGQQC